MRLRNYLVDPRALSVMLVTGSLVRVQDGIPEGAKIVSWSFDPTRYKIYITCEHESFSEHQEGCVIEEGQIVVELTPLEEQLERSAVTSVPSRFKFPT